MSSSEQRLVFTTRNSLLIRGTLYAAFVTLMLAIGEVVTYDLQSLLDNFYSAYLLIPVGLALFAGATSFLGSSVQVSFDEGVIRVRRGFGMVTGKKVVIRTENVHTGSLTVDSAPKGIPLLFAHSQVPDMLVLRYRWPEKKMMAVECRIPLRGFEDPVGLIEEVVNRVDPTWRLFYGGEKEFDVVTGRDIMEAAERAFSTGNRRRPGRNERESRRVLGENSECEIQNAERRSPRRRQLRMKKEADDAR